MDIINGEKTLGSTRVVRGLLAHGGLWRFRCCNDYSPDFDPLKLNRCDINEYLH